MAKDLTVEAWFAARQHPQEPVMRAVRDAIPISGPGAPRWLEYSMVEFQPVVP